MDRTTTNWVGAFNPKQILTTIKTWSESRYIKFLPYADFIIPSVFDCYFGISIFLKKNRNKSLNEKVFYQYAASNAHRKVAENQKRNLRCRAVTILARAVPVIYLFPTKILKIFGCKNFQHSYHSFF